MATPTSGNFTPPATWSERARQRTYNYRAQQTFQDTLVGNDEPALPFIRPAYPGFVLRSILAAALSNCLPRVPGPEPGSPGDCVLAAAVNHGKSVPGVARAACTCVSGVLSHCTGAHAGSGFDSAAGASRGRSGFARPGPESDGWHAGWTGIVQNANRGPDSAAVFAVEALALLCRIRALRGPGFPLSVWVVGVAQTSAYARSLFSVGAGLAAGASQFKVPLRVSIMANLRGLIFGLIGGRLPAFWTQALTIVVSIIVLFSGRNVCSKEAGGD